MMFAYVIGALISLVVLMLVTTYSLFSAGVDEGGYYPSAVPFISDTIDREPGKSIGSFLLFLAIMTAMGAITMRGVYYDMQIRKSDRQENSGKLKRILRASIWVGAVSLFGGLGVGSFAEHLNMTVHTVFAGVFFLGISVYQSLCIALDYKLKVEGKKTIRCRLALNCASLIGVLLFQVLMVLRGPTFEITYNASAVVELISFACLFAFFCTFPASMKNIKFTFEVNDRESA
mmetsp:Transcript_34682/g.89946  ORF Transcript_34682/g.89946 Transcript_34682/m.89946 type:complete len:232 (-) Transcript_34682:3138-3833(-)